MPGPAVYILAVVAAFGTAFLVKEFIYEPHIAPLIQEYRNERRRRRQGPMGVPLQSHSDTSDDEYGAPRQRYPEKPENDSGSDSDGFRRPAPRKPRRGIDIELEDLVAREIREWSSSANTQGLRLRKKSAQPTANALDEANQHLAFAPILPSRSANATQRTLSPVSSPTRMTSTHSTAQRTTGTTDPSTRAPHSPTRGNTIPPPASMLFTNRDVQPTHGSPQASRSPVRPSPPVPPRYSPEQVGKALPALPPSAPSANVSNEPAMLTLANLRPLSIPMARQLSTESSATSAMTARPPVSPPFGSDVRPPLPRLPSTPSDTTVEDRLLPLTQATSTSFVASPVHRPVPSLSQSYPQDLDYEHNVVLLSAPSSRSVSPFSVVGSGEGPGSPYVAFSALGGARGTPITQSAEQAITSTPSSPGSLSPPGTLGSQYISLPGSNATSAPGSPSGPRSGQATVSNPFNDPTTPQTATTTLDLDSDMSDWEHAGAASSPSPPRPTASRIDASLHRLSSDFESDEEDDGSFSDSGLSEASLSSWASVSGRSSNGA